MPPARFRGRFLKNTEKQRRETCSKVLKKYHQDRASLAENLNNVSSQDSAVASGNLPKWREGRRIVELGLLADGLRSCVDCGQPLDLCRTVDETQSGYGSILYVECQCGVLNSITTNKTQFTSPSLRGRPAFDVNTKAALGMLHSGIGHTQMSNLMSTLEIRGLHHRSMKDREKEVSPHVKAVASGSCKEALIDEAAKTKETERRNSKDEHDQPSDRTKGIFKYDMGWQKRGSGRTYDSKPGVGAMIGNETGKICAYSVRIKDCRKCQFYSNKGLTPPPHTCHKNWDGSSKAMEPDVGGELVKTVEAQGVDVDVIIMDDDATTMARIRKDMNHNISKWSDINHTSKHLGNSLYSLQKKHKSLTTPVIKWFQKCFKYAIAQNKGNVEECRSALQQIVPHAFGDHEKCSKTWCGYIRNSDTYKHSSLPYGKDLSGKTFQQDLEAVFSAFANNAEKIAPGGSTKDVESFNNMVAAKAPKRCHYSASGSLKTRVDCAVAQKNIGNGYVNTVNESLGMSPGRVYHEHAKRKDTQRKRQQEYESLITVKRRKIGLKLNQKTTNHVREVREGTTYQSGVATQHHADITEIPPPLVCPKTEPITQNNTCSKVFCDIETGSLQKDADILQISAVFTDKTYDQYITPTRCVAPAASAVTGLAAQGGVLFHNGTPVPTFPLQQALQAFLAWLNEIGNVMLIGHNFKSFDFPRLIHAYKKCHLDSAFKDSVTCISDTLLIFRDLCPELDNHKQEFLVSNFLKTSYEAHNSLADVQSLQKLCQSKIEDDSIYYKHSVTTSSVLSKIEFESKSVQNVESFQNLVAKKIVSKQMSLKLGNSGLCLKHVQLAYLRGGPDGIPELLKEKVDGKDRVTANKRVIDSLTKYIEESSK